MKFRELVSMHISWVPLRSLDFLSDLHFSFIFSFFFFFLPFFKVSKCLAYSAHLSISMGIRTHLEKYDNILTSILNHLRGSCVALLEPWLPGFSRWISELLWISWKYECLEDETSFMANVSCLCTLIFDPVCSSVTFFKDKKMSSQFRL